MKFEISTRKLTYSEVFGERNCQPCAKFDTNNCTLCNSSTSDEKIRTYITDENEKDDPPKELIMCGGMSTIQKELRCNEEDDCADGSDEGWHCSANTNNGAYAAGLSC